MPNWLASEICMGLSYAIGAWQTFKILKGGGLDYNLLKTWSLLGLLRVFEEYLEFLISWVPFYWLGKCLGLGLMFLPESNIASVVFDRAVVTGMDQCHHILNHLVVPNTVEFIVSLPWRVLLLVFPMINSPNPEMGNSEDKIVDTKEWKYAGIADRLRHLQEVNPAMDAGMRKKQGLFRKEQIPKDATQSCEEKEGMSVVPLPPPPCTAPPLPPPVPAQSPCQVSRLTASSKKLRRLSSRLGVRQSGRRSSAQQQPTPRPPVLTEAKELVMDVDSSDEFPASDKNDRLPSLPEGSLLDIGGEAKGVLGRERESEVIREDASLLPLSEIDLQVEEVATDGPVVDEGSRLQNICKGRGRTRKESKELLPPLHNGDSSSRSPNPMVTTPKCRPLKEHFSYSPSGATGGQDGDGNDVEEEAHSGRRSTLSSMSSFVRETLTGDPNIRLRDHLFDLKTASPPPPLDKAPLATSRTGAASAQSEGAKSSPQRKQHQLRRQRLETSLPPSTSIPIVALVRSERKEDEDGIALVDAGQEIAVPPFASDSATFPPDEAIQPLPHPRSDAPSGKGNAGASDASLGSGERGLRRTGRDEDGGGSFRRRPKGKTQGCSSGQQSASGITRKGSRRGMPPTQPAPGEGSSSQAARVVEWRRGRKGKVKGDGAKLEEKEKDTGGGIEGGGVENTTDEA
ncbi:unnamed protein product [Choristocarpus tenellus]